MTIQDRERITREKLKRYQLMRKRISQANEDIMAGQIGGHNGTPVQTSTHSDPTARGAERLLNMIEDEEWVNAIDDALAELKKSNPLIEQILRIHFRIEYATGYKRKNAPRVRRELMELQAISDTEYYSRLGTGITTVMIHAATRGLFRSSQ